MPDQRPEEVEGVVAAVGKRTRGVKLTNNLCFKMFEKLDRIFCTSQVQRFLIKFPQFFCNFN